MKTKPANSAIAASLLFAIFLWGANNTATKYLIGFWPPIFVGCTRFLAAGLILLALLRWTKIFGTPHVLTADLQKKLWWNGGLNLAIYIVAFNCAMLYTSASHVALYLGASPIWALLWEGRPEKNWKSVQRYSAAALAGCGVIVLFWPTLKSGSTQLFGEILALISSILWTNYGRQCRAVSDRLSGPEISAHTFLRAGLFVTPIALVEIFQRGLIWRNDLALIQTFCVLASGVVAFAIWNNALRHWKTSQVYLFNNLIPLSTMAWANICLHEPITKTFWMAMALIFAGVFLGQVSWQKILGKNWLPTE